MKEKVAILGAGLAGLTCAYELANNGIEVIILEKEPRGGGLAKSFSKDGFTYDYGPHRFHSNNKFLINFVKDLLGENIVERDRKSKIYMMDKFFMYPLNVNNIISNMPTSKLLKCFYDYFSVKIRNAIKPFPDNSFEAWVVNRFGWELYRLYFGIYTEKIWGIPGSKISPDWAAQRITLLSLWDTVKKTIFRPKIPPRTYISHFYYPREGGIGQICEILKERVQQKGGQIFFNTDVTDVKTATDFEDQNIIKSVIFNHNGKKFEEDIDHLMSTIPITTLPMLFSDGSKEEILSHLKSLKFRSVIFVYFILNIDSLSDNHWIYLPEPKFFSNRISEFKNFSEFCASKFKTIICAEISCANGDEKWHMDEGKLKDLVLSDLLKLGFKNINKNDILDYFCHKIENAYPIYDLNYKENMEIVFRYINSFKNLSYFGRNALFKYGNMDHSVEMGLKAAENFLSLGKKHDLSKSVSKQEYFG